MWSRLWDLNPQPSPWQGDTLPIELNLHGAPCRARTDPIPAWKAGAMPTRRMAHNFNVLREGRVDTLFLALAVPMGFEPTIFWLTTRYSNRWTTEPYVVEIKVSPNRWSEQVIIFLVLYGGSGGSRTPGLEIKSFLLYQLSYTPI